VLEFLNGPALASYKQRLANIRAELVTVSRKCAEIEKAKGKQAEGLRELAGSVGVIARILVSLIDSLPGKPIAPNNHQGD
jgi:hypothetical protein